MLFYSQVAWDTVWQRPQEQALGLSRHRPVIFVSPVQLHELTTRLHDRWRLLRRIRKGNLTVFSPLILSGEYRSPAIRAINRHLVARLTKRLLGGVMPIYMTNSPFSSYLIDAVTPRAVIYDLIDDFCAFSWAPLDGRETEGQIIDSADLVLAGTGYLRERYQHRFPGIEFLSSGVRYLSMTKKREEPVEIRNLPHPRLLYVGTLNDRLDGDLIARLAGEYPEASLVIVGPRHATFSAPPLPENVHFLGLKPHTELPGYYQHCDIGLMPFADSPAARAINPVKTLEYLACGLPVISTPVPDVEKYYAGYVRVERPENWGRAVRQLLAEDDPVKQESRREFAKGRSWGALTRRMETMIREIEAKFP